MKKLIAILMVLLCAFSLSAEWGRIQYIDEFGDVDPTISDPYQIASGTREVNGNTNYYYEYRFIASLPTSFGSQAGVELDMFDDFGDYVVFDAGDVATVRVKLDSGEIKEFTYDFTEYEYSWYDEYELDQVRQNIYLEGHDAIDLLNELYDGSDLRFVIYNGNIKYTFTIEADGFKEVANEFIDNFAVPSEPDTFRDALGLESLGLEYTSVSYYETQTENGIDYVLGINLSGFKGMNEYPSLNVSLDFKPSDDVFWYDNEKEYIFKDVRLVSFDGSDVMSLAEEIENDEYGTYFSLYDSPMIPEVIDFVNEHGSAIFVFEFTPELTFSVPVTAAEVSAWFSFPE